MSIATVQLYSINIRPSLPSNGRYTTLLIALPKSRYSSSLWLLEEPILEATNSLIDIPIVLCLYATYRHKHDVYA